MFHAELHLTPFPNPANAQMTRDDFQNNMKAQARDCAERSARSEKDWRKMAALAAGLSIACSAWAALLPWPACLVPYLTAAGFIFESLRVRRMARRYALRWLELRGQILADLEAALRE